MDIYEFLEENRTSINDDYNKVMSTWNKEWSDEALLEFIKDDDYWKNCLIELNIL